MKNFTRFTAVLMIGLALPAITAPAQEMPAQRRTLAETEMQQIAVQRLERLQEMHPERFEGMDEQRRQRALEQELQRLQRTHAQQEEKRTQRLDSLRQARHAARPDRGAPDNYPVSETDSLALVALYNATNGDYWYNNENWLTGPVNTWYGVSVCDGVVEGLWLWNNNLTGVIPDEIGDLSNLWFLELGWSNLTGEIPWTIGNLSNLYYLDLGSNNLTGEIPPTIGNCYNLEFLDVSYNQLFYIPIDICGAFNSEWRDFYFPGNYFDPESCPAIECLADKGVYMWEGWQHNGHDLLIDCFSCEYTIALYDDGGDGWNDGWLYVYSDWDWLDLTLWSGYGPETYSFNVRSDSLIYFVFYPGWEDPNPGECSYIVYNDVGEIIFQDGMNGAVPTGGSIPGECVGNDPYVNIGLDEDWICADGSGYYFENVTALNYWGIYWWANGYGYFDNEWGSLNPTYYPDEMDYQQGWVEICVEVCMEDNNWNWICDYDCMTLYFINPPEVDAGQEATIYANETFTAAQATADNYGSLLWSASGDGAFDDPTQLNPTYTPGLQDIITGSVELCLTGTTLDPAYCDDVTACMQLQVLTMGAPAIVCNPENVEQYLIPDQTKMQIVNISNTGDDMLYWIIDGNDKKENRKEGHIEDDLIQFDAEAEIKKGEEINKNPRSSNRNSGGPDQFGYTWKDSNESMGPVFNWVDISNDGTLVTGLSDDNYVGPFNIDFSFPFYENSYNDFYISSNGYISFGSGYSSLSNTPIPNSNTPNNFIAWCWDDLYPRSFSSVYYHNLNDLLIVQFKDYGRYGNSDAKITAEIILYPNGKIIIQYLNTSTNFNSVSSYTIGIENQNGTDGLLVAHNTSYIQAVLAVGFYPPKIIPDWIAIEPSYGVIDPGNSQDLMLTFNSTGLEPGFYNFDMTIASNASGNPTFIIPIVLNVVDGIFGYFELPQGWSGVSSYLMPVDPVIDQLVSAIEDKLIILRDFEGNFYQPDTKSLESWDFTKGYYIKMASEATLEIAGLYPMTNQLDLQQGWNLIPVLSDEPVVIEHLFSFHTDKLEIVAEVAGLKLFWPEMEIATLQELLPGKAYLVKANQPFNISFELSDLPSVTTAPVIDISVFSALSGGEVTDEGSTPVTARGVVWSVSPNPTIEHNDGITIDGAGAGAYVSELDGLTPHSTYYLRAYATNLIGTFYGEEIYFTTLWDCGDSYPFVDARDGQTYNTVLIGDQCWMKENLNFQTDDSWCYSNNVENCTNYGRLYTWHSALTSCPSGWRLPTDNEWTIMVSFVVSQGYPNEWYNPNGAGNALKSCRQVNSPLGGDCNTTQHPRWNSNSTHHGFDEFGFSIFPGGYRHTNGNFNGLGNMGICWVSTEVSTDSAWNRYLYSYEASVGRHYQTKVYGFSVRCVRD